MSTRRMFSIRLINSARFLRMPISSQALYFHLGMHADDDGIVEAYPVIKTIGCTEDDLRVLVAKGFVQVLNDDLVSYITDWSEHNTIRPDRKIDSIYKDLLLQMNPEVKLVEKRKRSDNELRSQMYQTSDLPERFNQVMRDLFYGEPCPICGTPMEDGKTKASIQHNTPISKGGKHELKNISVICLSCNMSLKDKGTGDLNNALVMEKWEAFLDGEDRQRTDRGQTEDGISKDKLSKDKLSKDRLNISAPKRFKPPTVEEVREYCIERNNRVDPERFVDYYTANGWVQGKGKPIKDWKAAVRNWERNEKPSQVNAAQQAAQERQKVLDQIIRGEL